MVFFNDVWHDGTRLPPQVQEEQDVDREADAQRTQEDQLTEKDIIPKLFWSQCDHIWPNFVTLAKHILRLWQNFNGLFGKWRNFEPALAIDLCYWAIFQCCKWPNVK